MMKRCVRLRCPECHDPQALACAIQESAGVVNVTIVGQTCVCDPYADFDDVWEQGLELAREGGLD